MEPFTFRSALYIILARDPRLDAVLVPAKSHQAEFAVDTEADVLIVSQPVEPPNTLMVTILVSSTKVEVLADGVCRTEAYQGPEWLADLLVAESQPTTWANDIGPSRERKGGDEKRPGSETYASQPEMNALNLTNSADAQRELGQGRAAQ